MSPPPTVSVIIPTYRHARFVEETLASVFAQTFTDYEVIVVNDGSPDDTAEVLRPYARDGRIRYFEQANAGQSTARNRGFAEARGEFIAFLDDDDLWPADKLSWQVAAMREHPEWVMLSGLSGSLEVDGTRKEPGWGDGGVTFQTVEKMFEGSCIDSPGQVLIRRETLAAMGGFDPQLWGTDDTDLWIRLAARGRAAQIERTALYYRLHAGNASNAAGRMFWNSVRMVRKNLPLVARERRGRVWSNAMLASYVYSGRRVVWAARQGGFRDWWAALRVLAYLTPTMLRDWSLVCLIGADVLPGRILTMCSRTARASNPT